LPRSTWCPFAVPAVVAALDDHVHLLDVVLADIAGDERPDSVSNGHGMDFVKP
jgi:hypothetical protein